ncbi:hypothetical protein D4R71_04475 [bacterium]|nr:MAG: hypothetical protein D4R71_04475 [bacterium]
MNIQQDFEELLELLIEHKVKYLIVGGYAVAFHGYPRFTNDIDIFYEMSEENVKKITDCLVNFGLSNSEVNGKLFLEKNNIIVIGVEPLRVDFINDIDGVEFAAAWENRIKGKYGSVEVNFISKTDLIKNKLKTKRSEDKLDVEKLTEI